MRLFWVIGVSKIKNVWPNFPNQSNFHFFFQYGKVLKERERGEKWVKFLN